MSTESIPVESESEHETQVRDFGYSKNHVLRAGCCTIAFDLPLEINTQGRITQIPPNRLGDKTDQHSSPTFFHTKLSVTLTLDSTITMAVLPDTIEKDSAERRFEHESLVEKAVTKFYDIDDPPSAEQQFEMFPDRAEGHDNLVYILMKMDGRTERMPIVFCIDCAAEKYVVHCNTRAWEYQYKPCAVDKDL
jgi:hypothetical protein